MPERHIKFLADAPLFLEVDNMLFVHGGIKTWTKACENSAETLLWDRGLVGDVMRGITPLTHYDMVYVGHTPTPNYGSSTPITTNGITMMDTGAGWGGRLSIMDINTHKCWQSDPAKELYPGEMGR